MNAMSIQRLLTKFTAVSLLLWIYIFAPLMTLSMINPASAATEESEEEVIVTTPTETPEVKKVHKLNICHKNSHTWVSISIDESAYPAHQFHGDFLYAGPLNDKGKPKKSVADAWCEKEAWHRFTVRICHYESEGVYSNVFIPLDGKFAGHRKHANDIIPNLTYLKKGDEIYYAGKNWPAGEATWRNNCVVVPTTPTPTVEPTETPTPTETTTPTPTETETPSVTPSETPTPTGTVEPTETPTPSVTPTDEVTPTVTPTDSVTPTATPTETPTGEPTETPLPTVTTSPTDEVTPTVTVTPTVSGTTTATPTDGTGSGEEVPDPTEDDGNTETLPPVTKPTVLAAVTTPTVTPSPEVLGERTCTNSVKLIGMMYVDANKNGNYDFGEQVFSNITGKVTYNVETKEFFVDHFISDNNGKWEMTLCPGEYNITVNKGSLPRGIVDSADVHKINVLGSQPETTAFVALLATSSWNFSWWWALLVVFILAVIYYIYRRRREYLETHPA